MKRAFILLALSLSLAGHRAAAQDAIPAAPVPAPATAAAVAAQEGADERYQRMAADIQALQMDNESLKARLASLEQKIDDLRQQQAAGNVSGLQEQIKRLADSLVEVDKKRQEDRLAISEEIRKAMGGLERNLGGAGAPARLPPAQVPPDTETSAAGNDFSYTIKDGDTLSVVVRAYNADYKSKGWKTISLKEVMDANPNVDPNRMRVGQRINIPRPQGQ